MNERDSAKSMLALACDDLGTLEQMLPNPNFSERAFGFHAQPATEKALKALLVFHDVDYPRTHDLRALVALLTNSGVEVPEQANDVLTLTAFGITFRYD
ncbi:MAG TPA: HEPN domain-containing protein [Candidatus Hydrogenedentes bacterium]|nr:HEPN domain-containing protein [Candidatus Hydrogenedentota bacterium]HPC16232.1 HEPN domain-containing protein [Candidatus Hydrogenedentota bacterium]HRT18556.1 HEPN domain-containing protein [Candidatus Hydrogenedentota bacterium]HRT63575.1 HEPN domain-containing protein [Candidatus Hydrogenedentota bacterium]